MNKRGQLVFIGIMVAAIAFIMIVSLVEPLKTQASDARVNLNCTSTELSAGEAGTCIVTDAYLFAFVGTALAVALGWLGVRRLRAGGG